MSGLKWFLGAVIGATVGGLVWTAIAHFAHMEIGWIAWGVGALTGLGVRMLAEREKLCTASGVLAAVVALLGVGGAKFAAVQMDINSAVHQMREHHARAGDELAVASLADEIATEAENRGKPIEWPTVEDEDAPVSAMYPAGIWAQAQGRWNDMPAEGRVALQSRVALEAQQSLEATEGMMRGLGFLFSFGLFDLLWAFLAATTAFKLASGGSRDAGADKDGAADESGVPMAMRRGGLGAADRALAPRAGERMPGSEAA